MKIDAPRAWFDGAVVTWGDKADCDYGVRIVRESDWRKIMAVLKAAEAWWDAPDKVGLPETEVLGEKLMVLALHLEKRKRKAT